MHVKMYLCILRFNEESTVYKLFRTLTITKPEYKHRFGEFDPGWSQPDPSPRSAHDKENEKLETVSYGTFSVTGLRPRW